MPDPATLPSAPSSALPSASPEQAASRPAGGFGGALLKAGLIAIIAIAVPGAVLLWLRYGTALFFDMIAAGIAACF